MINKILFYSLFVLLLCSCKYDAGNPSSTPDCSWQKNDDIHYQYVELKHPDNASDLLCYSRDVYPNSTYISSLLDVLGDHYEQSKSIIKVSVSPSGCEGTSKTTVYTKSNHGDLGMWSINNIYTPKNSKNEFDVKVEIKSGLHADVNGGEGYVVWTKSCTANQLDGTQSGVIQGMYKKVSNGAVGTLVKPILIYKNGEYLKAIL